MAGNGGGTVAGPCDPASAAVLVWSTVGGGITFGNLEASMALGVGVTGTMGYGVTGDG